jgi:hypothetical protein
MKVEHTHRFTPVVVTIETEDEARAIKNVLGRMTYRMYAEQAGFKLADDRERGTRLGEAMHTLYGGLNDAVGDPD